MRRATPARARTHVDETGIERDMKRRHAAAMTMFEQKAPAGRGDELFRTWAAYRRGGERTRSPVAKSGVWRAPVAHDTEPEWVIEIDRLVAYLGSINGVYPRILKHYYLGELAIWQVAQRVERTPGFVLLSLRAACDLAEQRVPA